MVSAPYQVVYRVNAVYKARASLQKDRKKYHSYRLSTEADRSQKGPSRHPSYTVYTQYDILHEDTPTHSGHSYHQRCHRRGEPD